MGSNEIDLPTSDSDPDPNPIPEADASALSLKIMLSAILILLFLVTLMVFLYLYARWYRRRLRLRRRRLNLVFYVENSVSDPSPLGLDPRVLESLPVFVYKVGAHPDPVNCAVCLSEMEENESGRTLPKCGHSFHLECIDMWFHSHSTCPLCRALVELIESPTGLVGPSSVGSGPGKDVGVVGVIVELALRRLNSGGEVSGSNERRLSLYVSPVGRMLSGILSWERRAVTPSSSSSSGNDVAEVDVERA